MKEIFRASALIFSALAMFVYGIVIITGGLWNHAAPSEVQLYREAILILIWYSIMLKADTWD